MKNLPDLIHRLLFLLKK